MVLNLYVINEIALEIPLNKILKGTLPFVMCIVIAIILLCIFPDIATWLPNYVMGEVI
jgi:C4-dicarboxylate transporter, DctM subunit